MEVVTSFTMLVIVQGLSAAVLFCDEEFMQKEGTNSAALTLSVENLLSMDLSCGGAISPLSACCSHESGAILFAIFIRVLTHPSDVVMVIEHAKHVVVFTGR